MHYRVYCLTMLLFATFANWIVAQDLYFPNSNQWETIAPADVGWDRPKLEEVLNFAVDRNSSSVVILYRGRILAERHVESKSKRLRYRGALKGTNEAGHVIEDVASCQKSIVSVLVGIAIERDLLQLEAPVNKYLEPGWSQAKPEQEAEIRIKHLLCMTSGLSNRLNFEAPAGTRWRYNTSAYAMLVPCLEAATQTPIEELTRSWLTEPIHMEDSHWVRRGGGLLSGSPANAYGFTTTARDLARFGLLILAKGRWNQEEISSAKYLSQATNTSQNLNPSYGYLWWLNGKDTVVQGTRRRKGPLISTAPEDLVAALGALGRKCYIVPSLELVVVRLGDTPETSGKQDFDDVFWRKLLQAKLETP